MRRAVLILAILASIATMPAEDVEFPPPRCAFILDPVALFSALQAGGFALNFELQYYVAPELGIYAAEHMGGITIWDTVYSYFQVDAGVYLMFDMKYFPGPFLRVGFGFISPSAFDKPVDAVFCSAVGFQIAFDSVGFTLGAGFNLPLRLSPTLELEILRFGILL